jgi:hypothetical protein
MKKWFLLVVGDRGRMFVVYGDDKWPSHSVWMVPGAHEDDVA